MNDPPPDERLGCFDRIKAFFATIGSIGMGLFVLFPPAKVKEEMAAEVSDEFRTIIGLGFLAYGILFGITAFFASGRGRFAQAVAARLKGLLFAYVAAVIGAALMLTVGKEVKQAHELAANGVATTAVVTYERRVVGYDKKSKRQQTIRFDGHRADLVLRPPRGRGERLPVLYLAADPDVVLPGGPDSTFLDLVEAGPGKSVAAGAPSPSPSAPSSCSSGSRGSFSGDGDQRRGAGSTNRILV